MPRRTPLNEAHRKLGARMVDFVGWDMPVQYTSVIAEHEAVRTGVGLFDVSHMGEIEFRGPGALESANALISNDLARCADGQAVYAGLLNEQGGFVDDVVAYRFSAERILVCVNASNVDKDFAWMKEHAKGVAPVNRSDDFAQIAVQGPKAPALVQRLTKADLSKVGTYRFTEGEVAGVKCIISRTGYTGEDGFELYCPPQDAEKLWNALMAEGQQDGVKPAGLGCRDSLRTEMKYALYGNDIDDAHTALEAGLGWIVKLDKAQFVGKDALVAQKAAGVKRKLVGFELTGAGVPRHGYPVLKDGQRVGEVTSGTMGPSVKKPIGMAYVPTELAAEGSTFDVDIRGRAVPATVVKTPFLKKS
ncbi:glycine cleavage system aminomethyltransferase GcvT [Aggregicoccus sp. 17bor-14]|uniref:glycine cleavage system aminomethyltransferase GcvT n=1 Tax=Myxococcaceae TaxID=31 RepID=UPI00129D2147|nr:MULTISPECIES: glycine cleavage system aminomethyltransferase GcvT [Myxococcaceae]MBF5041204.1 glycine cleavage system aminomethyltransferase GcvT [Simulacricoccus sp. 17bor-14]MRI86991.1 glycine cleavage system aminomethyltransferase GcvT [Aggregicoccus sp. 17bor-14]